MTVSNIITFNLTQQQIINQAASKIGVLRGGNSLATGDYNYCANELNLLIKQYETIGLHMWTNVEGTIFLQQGVYKYSLSSSSTHVSGDDTVVTILTAAGSSNSFVCSTVTGMNVSDNFGIVLDNGTTQWTTISSINTTTLTVTTVASLTSSASSGSVVFCYTNSSSKPLNISSVRFQSQGSTERIVEMLGRDEWMSLPQKTNPGKVNQVFYATGRDVGTLYVNPVPDSNLDCLNYSYTRTIDDFTTTTDTPDFPQEWLNVLVLNLSVNIASYFGKNLEKLMPNLIKQAAEALLEAQLWDVDTGSIRIVPSSDGDC